MAAGKGVPYGNRPPPPENFNFCKVFWGFFGMLPEEPPKAKGKGKGKKGKGKGKGEAKAAPPPPPPPPKTDEFAMFDAPAADGDLPGMDDLDFGFSSAPAPAQTLGDEKPGVYKIIQECAIQAEPAVKSQEIDKLAADSFVRVVELTKSDKCIRAKLEEPQGWITVLEEDGEKRFASRVPHDETIEAEEKLPKPKVSMELNKDRKPRDKQNITLLCEVVKGKKMPSVNTFGGCDPFVEVRLVKGDIKKSKLEKVPDQPIQTAVKEGETDPKWNETLQLRKAIYAEEITVQVILWDYNMTGNTPCGQASLPLFDALMSCKYNVSTPAEQVWWCDQQVEILGPGVKDCKLDLRFCYWEQHKFKLTVLKGSRLPVVDMMGTIDSFVEVRLVKGDQTETPFIRSAGAEAFWQGQTDIVPNQQDPKWKKEFTFTSHGDPELHLLIIVWDDDSPMPSQAVGLATIPLKDVVNHPPGLPEQEHKLKLSPVPGEEVPKDLRKASVAVSLSWELASKGASSKVKAATGDKD